MTTVMMLTSLAGQGMTGQVLFDSHVENLLATTVALVNRLSPGFDGGRTVEPPERDTDLRHAVGQALGTQGYDVNPRRVMATDARLVAETVTEARQVIVAVD